VTRPVILDRAEAEALLEHLDVWELPPEYKEVLGHLKYRLTDYLESLNRRNKP